MIHRHITQYLNRYATPDAQSILTSLVPHLKTNGLRYDTCLCIPAFAEDEPLENVWAASLQEPQSTNHLVIIFGNWPDNASPEDSLTTQKSLDRLIALYNKDPDKKIKRVKEQKIELINDGIKYPSRIHWNLLPSCPTFGPTLLLLHSNQGLPAAKGVGLARKVMMDIATGLFQSDLLKNPWVGTTDADAVLPLDYWNRLGGNGSNVNYTPGLLVFPFDHQFHDHRLHEQHYQKLIIAHQIYQASLTQYVAALKEAMPEFAYHTIGSIFAIHICSYVQVRGYPTLAAGEDFYLLNKIAKIASVTQLEGHHILLRPRQSQRTPFGTGPSICGLMAHKNLEQAPLFYHPKCLQDWTNSLQTLRQFNSPDTWSSLIPKSLHQKLLQQYQQYHSNTQKNQAFIAIMDGLRCQQLLKQIHQDIPRISWQDFLQFSG